MVATSDWADVARLRQGLYRFFGEGFRPPDRERFDALYAGAGMLDQMGIERFAFARPWWALLEVMETGTDLDALRGEHVRLFAAGADGGLCPPIESFYVAVPEGGGTASLMAAIDRVYREMGFVIGTDIHLAPDHVVLELEAMAMLAGDEADLWSRGDGGTELTAVLQRQRSFLTGHLAVWFPAFSRRVVASSPGFYGSLVDACGAFVHHDQGLLDVVAASIEAGVTP